VRAHDNRPQLAVASEPLERILVVLREVAPKLREDVPQERRVGDDRDAFLRPLVEPLQEGEAALVAAARSAAPSWSVDL